MRRDYAAYEQSALSRKHWLGLALRPQIAALSMSGSSLIVAVNALMLKRLNLPGERVHRSGSSNTACGSRQGPSTLEISVDARHSGFATRHIGKNRGTRCLR